MKGCIKWSEILTCPTLYQSRKDLVVRPYKPAEMKQSY